MKNIAVIKIGRSITTTDKNTIDQSRFKKLAKQIKKLHQNDMGIILVVSGAVITGKTEFISSDKNIVKNLYAALGQAHITSSLYSLFSSFGIPSGQMLLTRSDLKNINKREQIRKVLLQAIENKIVIIINENDTIELNSFSGNDILATKIAKLIRADKLVLLSDIKGVYDKQMKIIPHFQKKDFKRIAKLKKDSMKEHIGGIETKLDAALDAKDAGIEAFIAHGQTSNVLLRILVDHEQIGTTVI